jgi:multidrug efflux pump subunit AcrA (membrane-fusion protein)
VQQGATGHVVYVVKSDGMAELRPVVVGDYHGDKEIFVLSGLRADERVVVDGAMRVVPGQPVKVVDAAKK